MWTEDDQKFVDEVWGEDEFPYRFIIYDPPKLIYPSRIVTQSPVPDWGC